MDFMNNTGSVIKMTHPYIIVPYLSERQLQSINIFVLYHEYDAKSVISIDSIEGDFVGLLKDFTFFCDCLMIYLRGSIFYINLLYYFCVQTIPCRPRPAVLFIDLIRFRFKLVFFYFYRTIPPLTYKTVDHSSISIIFSGV